MIGWRVWLGSDLPNCTRLWADRISEQSCGTPDTILYCGCEWTRKWTARRKQSNVHFRDLCLFETRPPCLCLSKQEVPKWLYLGRRLQTTKWSWIQNRQRRGLKSDPTQKESFTSDLAYTSIGLSYRSSIEFLPSRWRTWKSLQAVLVWSAQFLWKLQACSQKGAWLDIEAPQDLSPDRIK